MHILQQPLLDFNEFFALDESDRLVLILQTINAEPLLYVLQGEDDLGRTGYQPRILWAALIAGVVYRIPSVAELRRHLLSNPHLRYVCGMTSAANVPSESTLSRFLTRLIEHYEVPIAAILTTGKEGDTTQLKPLLEKRDELLPDTALNLCVCDGGYDSRANIVSITERGAIPIIPFNPGNKKEPPGITNTLGIPLCPVGLVLNLLQDVVLGS